MDGVLSDTTIITITTTTAFTSTATTTTAAATIEIVKCYLPKLEHIAH